jgi:hypothetical protein
MTLMIGNVAVSASFSTIPLGALSATNQKSKSSGPRPEETVTVGAPCSRIGKSPPNWGPRISAYSHVSSGAVPCDAPVKRRLPSA